MKKIIIIGAGVSGLSAGIYGRINGFQTEIFEMHSVPGGECTGWNRGEYHFDGCIHYLMGTISGTPLNKIWQTVGALDNSVEIINTECFFRIEENGEEINIYRDIDRLESHLLEKAPEDGKAIGEMCNAVRALQKLGIPSDKPMELYTPLDIIKMILKSSALMPYIKKYGSISVEEFSSEFKNPLLQSAICNSMPNKNVAFNLLCILASMSIGDNNWPKGGSRAMTKRMEMKYRSMGGEVHYQSRVESISIAEGRAKGIILADGSEHYADFVISTTDGHWCLSNLLKGAYSHNNYDTVFGNPQAYPTYSTVQVSLGIACDLSKRPDFNMIKMTKQLIAGDCRNDFLKIKHFCYDPTIAPPGKSVITVLLDTNYDWWNELRDHKEAYMLEKRKIATQVCEAIEEFYPEIKGKTEQVDVATPVTYEHYCNAYQGAYMSWIRTPQSKINFLPMSFKKLKNFYMAGQWTVITGGLPLSVISGKWAVQLISKECKTKFLQ